MVDLFSVFFSSFSFLGSVFSHTDEAETEEREKERKKTLIQKLDGLMMLYFTSIWCAYGCWAAVYIKRVYYFQVLYINSHYYHVNAIICRRVFVFNTQMNTQRYTHANIDTELRWQQKRETETIAKNSLDFVPSIRYI